MFSYFQKRFLVNNFTCITGPMVKSVRQDGATLYSSVPTTRQEQIVYPAFSSDYSAHQQPAIRPPLFLRQPQTPSTKYTWVLPPDAACIDVPPSDPVSGPCSTLEVSCEDDGDCNFGKKCCDTAICGKRCNYDYQTVVTG